MDAKGMILKQRIKHMESKLLFVLRHHQVLIYVIDVVNQVLAIIALMQLIYTDTSLLRAATTITLRINKQTRAIREPKIDSATLVEGATSVSSIPCSKYQSITIAQTITTTDHGDPIPNMVTLIATDKHKSDTITRKGQINLQTEFMKQYGTQYRSQSQCTQHSHYHFIVIMVLHHQR